MKRRAITALALALPLLLSACSLSQYRWQHPQLTDAQSLEQNQLECRELASRHAAESDVHLFTGIHLNHRPAALGHRRSLHDSHFLYDDRDDRYRRYFRICMEARGWERVKIESTNS